MLRTAELGIGFWIDEGLSVGIADRPLTDIPAALRKDGSPPLYYMLLHFWLGARGGQRGGRAVLQPRLRAAGHPGRVVGGPDGLGHAEGGLVRGRPDGLQPVPEPVRAGSAHVRDGGAARDPGDGLLPARLRAGHRQPAPVDHRLRASRKRSRSTRTTGRSSSARPPASRGSCCWRISDRRRELFKDGLLGLRRRRRAVPAVGADDALPGPAHRAPRGPTRPPSARCSASRA